MGNKTIIVYNCSRLKTPVIAPVNRDKLNGNNGVFFLRSANMEYHELANMFPMVDANIKAIAASISEGGYNKETPIVLYQGKILDGRHRWEACKLTNTQPEIIYYTGNDPLKYVIDKNLNRYHLNESQRAVVAAKLANMKQGTRTDLQHSANLRNVNSETLPQVSQAQAAEMLNVSDRSIQTIKAIERKAPELIEKIERGEMTAGEASREIKKAAVIEKVFKPAPEIPTGKYKVIYIDPPWQVGSMQMDKWESPIEDKYPTMSISDIIALPIKELADDDCALFIWTTHTFLPDTFHIIKEWGFKYFCTITWDKEGGWTQNGFHKRTEFLLYAYKGSINVNQYGKAIPTIFTEAKTRHSKKPDSIRDMIAEKTPEPRLEMFARDKFDGWTVWGNEV